MAFKQLFECKFLTDRNHLNEPTHGPIVDLNNFNKYFFGIIENPLRVPYWHHVDKDIFIEFNGKTYLKIDKLNDYIKLIGDISDREIYLSLYNFNNVFNNWDNVKKDSFNFKFKTFMDKFIDFLKLNKNKYDVNKYRLYKTILKCLEGNFVRMYLSNYECITQTWIITCELMENIKCDITFGLTDYSSNSINYLNLNNYNYIDFIRIAAYLVQSIRTSGPEKYIIGNLTEITGNKYFSKILYESYKKGDESVIPIELIVKLINWKDSQAKTDYLTYFQSHYNHCIDDSNLNFEGFNKFFLSLELSYLKNFEEKEKINNLYTSITSGLIKGYEELYEYIKQ